MAVAVTGLFFVQLFAFDYFAETTSSTPNTKKSARNTPGYSEPVRKASLQTGIANGAPGVDVGGRSDHVGNDKSGTPPSEYMLDKDYIDDSSNPLEEYMRQHRQRTTTTSSTTMVTTSNRDTATTMISITTTAMVFKALPQTQGASTMITTNPKPEAIHVSKEVEALLSCVTRPDARSQGLASWRSSSAPDGSHCVFGVDPRDEGSHCIEEHGDYGTFGWCYTCEEKKSWGSCSEMCPLSGQVRQLARKLMFLNERLKLLTARLSTNTSRVIATPIARPNTSVSLDPDATALKSAGETTEATNVTQVVGPPKKKVAKREVEFEARSNFETHFNVVATDLSANATTLKSVARAADAENDAKAAGLPKDEIAKIGSKAAAGLPKDEIAGFITDVERAVANDFANWFR